MNVISHVNGTSTIQAKVINTALIAPGKPFGTMNVPGNDTQNATGILLIPIFGPNQEPSTVASPFQGWSRKPRSKTGRRVTRLRLVVDQLEDRRLLAAPVFPKLPPGHPSPAASSSASSSAVLNLVPARPQDAPGPTGYTPAQVRDAYGFDQVPGISNENRAGQGETIAIVDAFGDPDIRGDVQQFDETFQIGGAAGNATDTHFLQVVNQYGGSPQDVPGPGTSGWDVEESIDVEWAHAIAPGADILLVQADSPYPNDLDTAVQFAASQPNVCVVSMSYDLSGEFNNEDAYDSLYTTPAGHQGVAFVTSSGDFGAPPAWQNVSPNVIAVGGTTLPPDQNGNPDRSQEVGWSLGSDANLPVNPNPYIASGGGVSQFEAQPLYQQGAVTQTTIYRTDPDVAYDADPLTGVPIYDSLSSPPEIHWGQFGGTSIGAPQWAALIAIADQARAAKGENTFDGGTQLLPALYQIAQTDPRAFDDITQGDNGYSAGPGYDLVTGLGTPNAQYLIPDLVKIDSRPATPATLYWTGDAGDSNWDDPGNWSWVDPAWHNVPESALPGPDDNVVIDVAGAVVNHAITSYDTIRSLTVTARGVTLNLDSGTVDLSGGGSLGTFQADRPGDLVNLMGGVLKSARVSSGTTITVPPTAIGIVDGGVLNGTLQALDNSTLELEGSWTNRGTITAATGSTLILGDYWNAAASDPDAKNDAWVNHGTISADDATVELGGWLTDTSHNLDSLDLDSNIVELIGTLDNRHRTLALVPGQTSSTGSWSLNGGRIDGGTITTTGGAALAAASGTLDGVTLNGTLDMSADGATVAVVDGLTLNTDLDLSGSGADLQFNDGSTVEAGPLVQNATIHLSGAGAFLFNNTGQNALLNNDPSQTVTVGRGITISGESTSSGVYGPIDNQGTIEQNTDGQMTVVELANDGTVEVSQGGTVTVDSQVAVAFTGFFGASIGLVPGQPWINNARGTITATQGGTLDLYDQWTNDGMIRVDASSTVSLGSPANYASDSPATSDIWKNSGTMAIAPDAAVNLGDDFTTDEFESGFQNLGAHLNLSQYTVNLIGTLDNSPADNPTTGGTLTLGASTDPLYLSGGEIVAGTITGTSPIVTTSAGGTLDGVVVDGAVNVPASTSLTLQGDWSTTANGSITATGATLNLYDNWTNNGTITVDAASTVSLGNFSFNLAGARDIWKNSGVLSIAPGATINLGDFFTTDEYENGFQSLGVDLNLSQYTVNLIGTLDNSPADNPITGGILALDASTGPLILGSRIFAFSAEIDRGTITTDGTDDLIANWGTLDGVTLDGTLDMSGVYPGVYPVVGVMGGLTLDTDLYLSGDGADLNFLDGSTVAVGPLVQNATIHLNGGGAGIDNHNSLDGAASPTVTLARGITISNEESIR